MRKNKDEKENTYLKNAGTDNVIGEHIPVKKQRNVLNYRSLVQMFERAMSGPNYLTF